ncbi:MAG: hypothetical protein Phog2KO_02230 [Phototrophicaceae bacterium]
MSSQGKYKVAKKDPLRAFLPIIGIIIMVVAGAVGWFSSPFVLEFLGPYIPTEVTTQLDEFTLQILVAVVIFFMLIATFSAIYAMFAPKPSKLVTESALKKERDAKAQERRRTKARSRKMKARMKEANKDFSDLEV